VTPARRLPARFGEAQRPGKEVRMDHALLDVLLEALKSLLRGLLALMGD